MKNCDAWVEPAVVRDALAPHAVAVDGQANEAEDAKNTVPVELDVPRLAC